MNKAIKTKETIGDALLKIIKAAADKKDESASIELADKKGRKISIVDGYMILDIGEEVKEKKDTSLFNASGDKILKTQTLYTVDTYCKHCCHKKEFYKLSISDSEKIKDEFNGILKR